MASVAARRAASVADRAARRRSSEHSLSAHSCMFARPGSTKADAWMCSEGDAAARVSARMARMALETVSSRRQSGNPTKWVWGSVGPSRAASARDSSFARASATAAGSGDRTRISPRAGLTPRSAGPWKSGPSRGETTFAPVSRSMARTRSPFGPRISRARSASAETVAAHWPSVARNTPGTEVWAGAGSAKAPPTSLTRKPSSSRSGSAADASAAERAASRRCLERATACERGRGRPRG